MPSFSRNLEESLHRAVAFASQRKHEYATLEHLLLSLIDDADAAGVMRACDVDLAALKKSLVTYVDNELKSWSSTMVKKRNRPPGSRGSFSAL